MIAKHIPMQTLRKSNFVELVHYLTDTQQKHERVVCVTLTNCASTDPESAALEVLATQALNKRAQSDRTYHLVVSFAPGENPTPEVLHAIEERLCQALGYREHQRVSVVHDDTDNLHIHIAINKIHPQRRTIHDPRGDYKILGAQCEWMEREYGLQQCNHTATLGASENRAADLEQQAGIESLLGWIQRECGAQILAASSWKELHELLGEHGLKLHERGNGLVFTASDGTHVKASSVDRALSKRYLEARLGPFHPSAPVPPAGGCGPGKQYVKRPLGSKHDTTALYARYQATQSQAHLDRAAQLAEARKRKDEAIKAAKRSGRLKRAIVKLASRSAVEKRVAYALISRALLHDLEKAHKQYVAERQSAMSKSRRQVWADWLRTQALAGDEDALLALRRRNRHAGFKDCSFSGEPQQAQSAAPNWDGVTKRGTIIYADGTSAVRDDGACFSVSRGATQESIITALQMAKGRYGHSIHVEGSDAFKEQVVNAAVAAQCDLHFDSPELEQRRQSFIHQRSSQENNHERQKPGRSVERGNGSSSEAKKKSRTRHPDAPKDWPYAVQPGSAPPPAARNRLRKLSQLGMVRIASGSEVLLPGDVPHNVEQPRANPDQQLRRNNAVVGAAGGAGHVEGGDKGIANAEQYVFEREQKRANGFDITKHKRYDGFIGTARFGGLRDVNGQKLALIKLEDVILVQPVNDDDARRLHRLAIGQEITLVSDGTIHKKGRAR